MTDLAKFQEQLREQGYVQVPRTELTAMTYAIAFDTDVFVVNGEYIDRYFFTTEGKTAGVKMKDQPLSFIKPKHKKEGNSAPTPQTLNESEE